ncbi:MAG: dTMP kinase [Myxococcales bacterium]|nr:dTMP kinase [Myxococcales bacterium]USN50960.1 MAG: dTMP kinase [Myxococcales bacterium]
MAKLIVVEGMDGAGTTTQTKLLVDYLNHQGMKVLSSAEPTKSSLGLAARKFLASPIENEPHLLTALALCFAADRMQHIYDVLEPALKTHDFIVLDRYVLSSLVYQGLHLPTTFVKEINRYALVPHLTIVLDVNARVAFERLSGRNGKKDFYESADLLEKIKARYIHFAGQDPAHTVLVDASGDISQVHSHIVHLFKSKYKV